MFIQRKDTILKNYKDYLKKINGFATKNGIKHVTLDLFLFSRISNRIKYYSRLTIFSKIGREKVPFSISLILTKKHLYVIGSDNNIDIISKKDYDIKKLYDSILISRTIDKRLKVFSYHSDIFKIYHSKNTNKLNIKIGELYYKIENVELFNGCFGLYIPIYDSENDNEEVSNKIVKFFKN